MPFKKKKDFKVYFIHTNGKGTWQINEYSKPKI